ncbi:glycosyltransferase involved in cell wall biosynthesis [Marinobacter nauticus]|uniref:Glycosyltransferase involved in cell wall biosynthesis n=1 Tax=Marinobacter nauticus TaxID=2743 RepID=A0A368XEZ0_MARNT|nr:glycosyltransferase [Marinobacter nauticus]RCW66541.1 glycosyltransferase involved in cell wall biosynthesis [Marinobacter nauticus]
MKVCQIMAGDEEGGLENHFVELCNGLVSRVDEVVVIAHEKYRTRFRPEARFLSLDLSGKRRNPWLLWRLATLLRRESPDIVHAQASKAVDMLARIRGFVPGYRIGTLHGRKKNLGMYKKMQTVIGVSKGVVEGLQHRDIRVVYNGVTPYAGKTYSRPELADLFALEPDLSLTLAVGRLAPVKAFDNLIKAWKPGFGKLLIIGDGPERASLETLFRRRGLGQHVVLAGFRQDVPAILPAADLLVFSSHREGFSYVLAEALLSRLPVLSTAVPGAMEVLPPDYLVPVNDVTALQRALERVLTDPAVARSEQASLFDWARGTLTTDRMLADTVAIYNDVLQAQGGP